MRCSACNGVFHEATGQYLSEKTRLCGACVRRFVVWLKGVTRSRKMYAHAETSREKKPA